VVVAALLCLLGVCALPACDVGGIPSPETTDSGLEDGPEQICTPNERYCEGLEVISCNATGTREHTKVCPLGTACFEGSCDPVRTQCDDDDQTERPSFSVSKNKLVFEINDDLKSSTASLDITNCGDSPITLQSIGFGEQPTDHSTLPDVFTLQNAPSEPIGISPGGYHTVTVAYQPLYAYSRQGGHLIINISGPGFQRFSIPLEPRAHCISATPEIDLGLFDDQASGVVKVHNCGTEPVELLDVRLEPNSDAAHSRIDSSLTLTGAADDDSAAPVLERGEHLEFDLELTARELGPLDHQVVFNVANPSDFRDPTPSTELIGRVVADSCHQIELEAPLVWGEQLDDATQWSVDDIPLDQVVYVEMQPSPQLGLFPIFSLVSPEASRARLEAPATPLATSAKASFTPDVAGEYAVSMNVLDAEGRPMCDPPTLTLHARPTSELYVDLRWETHGDPIPSDTGFGYGADLNLYMTATDELDDTPMWEDLVESCYGLGELSTVDGDETQSDSPSYLAQCQNTDAQIRSLSVTTAHREIMVVEEVEQRFYHIGVRSWSMYDFDEARAYLSVYAHGERVAQVDLATLWWGSPGDEDYEGDDYQPDELLEMELEGRQAWHYGVWDAQNNRLLPRPPRRYGGRFP
jgi:hypothetical protein